ncbi:MAG: SMP-30/gluconolactonase/LRE family protein [Deltaproteobacteria bacterium]|nr:SMP-30/gluconolactonase/LRE family protein [Deltaproteobacteria bacterium]
MQQEKIKFRSHKKINKHFQVLMGFRLVMVLLFFSLGACGGTSTPSNSEPLPPQDNQNTGGGSGGQESPTSPGNVGGGSVGAFSFPVVIEENFDYPDQAGWPGWVLPEGAPDAASIVDQRACLQGPANTLLRMVYDTTESYQEIEATYTAFPQNIHSQGMGFYGPQNGYYLNGGTVPGQGLVAYFEGGSLDDLGFWTEISGVETKRASVLLNTVLGETVTAEAGFPGDAVFKGRYRVERIAYNQIRLRSKLWRLEDPEPELWNLEYIVDTGPGLYSIFHNFAGTIALDVYNYNVAGQACFDDVVVRDLNPDPLAGVADPVEVASGFGFTEGPVWIAEENTLIFSDITADTLYAYAHEDGSLQEFRPDQSPDALANGLARDLNGDLLICEQAQQRLVLRDSEANQSVIASGFEGEPFNSPNDVIVHSSGAIYMTDPTYGTLFDGGLEALQTLGFRGIYRIEEDGTVEALYTNAAEQPNGLAFSPDESRAYVAFTDPAEIRAYQVLGDGSFSEISGEGFPIALSSGGDGLKVDQLGNLYVASGNEVRVYSPFGDEWGSLSLPMPVRNLAFGGPELKHLYITAGTSLYRTVVNVPGVVLPGSP